MKKNILFIFTTVLFLLSIKPVMAVDLSPEARVELMQKARETARVKVQEQTQMPEGVEPQQVRSQVQERVENRANIMQMRTSQIRSRYTHYENRMSAIATKIQARLNQLAQEGKDVSEAQQKLNMALSKIEIGMTQSQEAISRFEQIDPEQFQEQKQVAQLAQGEIWQARTTMQEAKTLMKQAVESAKLAQ